MELWKSKGISGRVKCPEWKGMTGGAGREDQGGKGLLFIAEWKKKINEQGVEEWIK